MTLDPEAVEAAAKKVAAAQCGCSNNGCPWFPGRQVGTNGMCGCTPPHKVAAAATAAYMQAIGPKLWERVEALRWASIDFGTTEEGSISEERTLQRMYAELTNLYALFGLEAE